MTNIGKNGFKVPVDEEEEKTVKKLEKYYQPLTTWMKDLLKDEVDNVNINFHN